ncbi:hypothetical protein C0995_012981, partial [Termitomyces sp. Mi166
DRANIGNALLAGLQEDLDMTNHQYSIVLMVTFIPYILMEIPINLTLKAVGPHLLLPTMLTLWGTVATLQGAFSGLLAYAIVRMHGVGGRPGWAWIFIIEGLFSVAFGLFAFIALPRSPVHARFLSNMQKEYITSQLRNSGAIGRDERADLFSWAEVWKAFTLPQVWMLSFIAFLSGTILLAYISDRLGARGFVIIFSNILATIGLAMFLASDSLHVKYGSLFFIITGGYSTSPALFTWIVNNASPYTR